MYMRPFTTSRMITVRLPPPVLPGRISGSTSPHSSSVRSLGYRNLLRSQRARFWLVHIGDPSSNQATTLESQMIHMIQELFGQTLREGCISSERYTWRAVSILFLALGINKQLDLQTALTELGRVLAYDQGWYE